MIRIAKLSFILVVILMSFIFFGCDKNEISLDIFNDKKYNAILIAQPKYLSSRVSNLDVEFKENVLYFEGEEIGIPIKSKIYCNSWMYNDNYEFFFEGDFDFLFENIECLEITLVDDFVGANCFCFVVNEDDKYLLQGEKTGVGFVFVRAYLLNEVR